ncbi:Dynein regulatory complex subunit 6 [Chytriomyces hyalinus]|nr:Dynein regulatory complex subunit 6 [Chytriomyces hyalinus]
MYERDVEAGTIALSHGDSVRALGLFNKALAAEPDRISLLDVRALILTKMGRVDEALSDANKMCQVDPKCAMGYLRAARIFKKKGLMDAAFKMLKIGNLRVDASDPDRKALETMYIQCAAVLGVTLKRKKPVDPALPTPPSLNPNSTTETKDSSTETLLPLPEAVPATEIHNFGTHSIPFEVIQTIFEYLPLQEITRCLRLNTTLRAMLSNNKSLWRDLNLKWFSHRISDTSIASLMIRGRDQVKSIQIDCIAPKNKVTKAALRAIQSSRSRLETLEFTHTKKVAADILVATVRMHSWETIRRVNFSGTEMTNDAVGKLFEKCRHLQELELAECTQITDSALDSVLKIVGANRSAFVSSQAELVDLPASSAAAGAAPRIPLFHLKILNVAGCIRLTDGFIHTAARCFPLMETINISKLTRVTHRALESLGQHCKNLKGIDASDIQFTYTQDDQRRNTLDTSMLLLAKECKGLTNVRIASCKFVNDMTVQLLTALCPQLESLEFPKSANITNAALPKIGNRCKLLTRMNLSTCPQITYEGLERLFTLATVSNEIKFLDLSMNPLAVNDKTLLLLSRFGLALEELNISGCDVTGAGVLAFAEAKVARDVQKMGQRKGGSAVGQLRVLNLDQCARVGNDAVVHVRKLMPYARVSANL